MSKYWFDIIQMNDWLKKKYMAEEIKAARRELFVWASLTAEQLEEIFRAEQTT
jgi:hypothetical protein